MNQAPVSHLEQLHSLRAAMRSQPAHSANRISLTFPALDQILPCGITEGSLIELLSEAEGTGASVLAFLLGKQLQRAGFTIILIDEIREFYPPGAAQLGIDLDHLIVIQARSQKEQLWAIEQSLRCAGKVMVIAPLGRTAHHTYRRLKLAAEQGGSVGLFLKPATQRISPSWADFRLLVESRCSPTRCRRFTVTALNSLEGTASSRNTLLELNDVSGALSLAPQLVNSATPTQFTRAS